MFAAPAQAGKRGNSSYGKSGCAAIGGIFAVFFSFPSLRETFGANVARILHLASARPLG